MAKNDIYLIGVPPKSKKVIRQTVFSAIQRSRKELRYHQPLSVVIFEAPPDMVISETGTVGSAIGRSGIEVRIDFDRKFQKGKFTTELSASIIHETTHLVRESAAGYNRTLLDAMINEGIACFVEKYLLPHRKIPYIAPIKNENKLLKLATPLLFKNRFDYSKWFFGAEHFPKWVGYRLGYLMVERYTKDRKISLPDLARTKSLVILRG